MTKPAPALQLHDVNVHYGQAHIVQSVNLTLTTGVHAIVGRNGMGKSSLCQAITAMTAYTGRILLHGQALEGLAQHRLAHLGLAYVPQGRRVWASLTVQEHLKLAASTARQGDWNLARIHEVFPKLAQRNNHLGTQLSGGEQQMLAIARALLLNPLVLIMDEPTEGLAPAIVEEVMRLIEQLAREHNIAILLVEQNIGVASEVADVMSIMVNGHIAQSMDWNRVQHESGLLHELLGLSDPAQSRAH